MEIGNGRAEFKQDAVANKLGGEKDGEEVYVEKGEIMKINDIIEGDDGKLEAILDNERGDILVTPLSNVTAR
jgi:hypothetical protein